MLPSLMAASVLACLIFLFLLPCFSMPCTPALPCNQSIQIRRPFYYGLDTAKNPSCQGYFEIGCNENGPFLNWSPMILTLESISYSTNIIRVQDPSLNSSLYESGCGNLYFEFQTPVSDFNYNMYDSLSTSLSFMRCIPPNRMIQSPPNILDKDYNLCYSPVHDKDDTPRKNCLRSSDDSIASFELILLFENDGGEFSLKSASYSSDLVAQPGCFSSSTGGCSREEGKEKHNRTGIIIGSVVVSAFLFAFFGLLLLFCKYKKLRSASSSSKLLVQRETSDQYHDLEMTGSGYTQIFSYAELEEATEGFSASKELGDGGFGIVYKGKLKDGRTVAVKRLYKNNYNSTEQFMNEVEILSRLHHPHLVTLYGCTARSSHELILVYEYVPNGTLADHLHGPRSSKISLTWPVRLSIAIETANALAYLHAVEPPVIHRDVKTNNILLDGDFHVKVADFGLSRLFPLDVTHVSTVPQGTPGYVDPVYHQCYHLTDKSDVYSFGVVLVELISSKQAVDLNRSKDEINLANMAVNKIQRSQLDDLVDPAIGFGSNCEVRCMVSLVAELAFRCLQSDREMRPSIKEVLEALKGIEKGSCSGDKLVKENMPKEETYLLKCVPNFSSDIMSDNSSSTTPNTSG